MDDDTGRRELFIPFGAGAYVLRYRIDRDTVIVIRVWHSREARE
jgi:plasmid stabilization system protein ParE